MSTITYEIKETARHVPDLNAGITAPNANNPFKKRKLPPYVTWRIIKFNIVNDCHSSFNRMPILCTLQQPYRINS